MNNCNHSFDVDGVCELCGLGRIENMFAKKQETDKDLVEILRYTIEMCYLCNEKYPDDQLCIKKDGCPIFNNTIKKLKSGRKTVQITGGKMKCPKCPRELKTNKKNQYYCQCGYVSKVIKKKLGAK